MSKLQEHIDTFYWMNGPCCAGCDWWRSSNSSVGECRASKPVPAAERWAMTGITNCSLNTGAGHIITLRDHRCGDFKDDFDWHSLPVTYLKRVGAPLPPSRSDG